MDMVTFYEIMQSLRYDKDSSWQPYESEYRDERDIESYHLVKFELETGKKHQIRLASSYALGSPIVGDFTHQYDSQRYSNDLLRRSFKYTKL